MFRKPMVTVGLVLAIAVPAGAAVAQDRDEDQDRLRERDCAQTCDQQQERLGNPERMQIRVRAAEQDRDQQCTYPATDGSGGGYADGVQDGTGPVHEGPQDGTGSQHGRSGS